MRERKPLKNPYQMSFTASEDFDLKAKLVIDLFRFIRENKGRTISIVLEIKK